MGAHSVHLNGGRARGTSNPKGETSLREAVGLLVSLALCGRTVARLCRACSALYTA